MKSTANQIIRWVLFYCLASFCACRTSEPPPRDCVCFLKEINQVEIRQGTRVLDRETAVELGVESIWRKIFILEGQGKHSLKSKNLDTTYIKNTFESAFRESYQVLRANTCNRIATLCHHLFLKDSLYYDAVKSIVFDFCSRTDSLALSFQKPDIQGPIDKHVSDHEARSKKEKNDKSRIKSPAPAPLPDPAFTTFQVSGAVVDASGKLLAGVVIETRDTTVVSGPDGQFRLTARKQESELADNYLFRYRHENVEREKNVDYLNLEKPVRLVWNPPQEPKT
ncbi:MAG: carboxypeptidase regulatory-like domain-containing protein [Phaeodactylibacter sp.]|nr:carboxypeptidase regulatory-like domain-containing protein [Phaeodactylibacter sp.]